MKKVLLLTLIISFLYSCGDDNNLLTSEDPDVIIEQPRLSGLATNNFSLEEPEELTSIILDTDLPISKDLSFNMPPVLNQGLQESTVAFTTAYYLKSYQEKIQHNYEYISTFEVMSPAFTYNKVKNNESCAHKISIENALYSLKHEGANRWKHFVYNDTICNSSPNEAQLFLALENKISSYHLVEQTVNYPSLIILIKNLINQNIPVITGVKIDNDFRNALPKTILEDDSEIYIYNHLNSSFNRRHSILITGYDDELNVFKFVNSWGEDWANDGYGFINYNFFVDPTDTAFEEGFINAFVAFDAL